MMQMYRDYGSVELFFLIKELQNLRYMLIFIGFLPFRCELHVEICRN